MIMTENKGGCHPTRRFLTDSSTCVLHLFLFCRRRFVPTMAFSAPLFLHAFYHHIHIDKILVDRTPVLFIHTLIHTHTSLS